ncbi:MAG: tetratricopeptide repeat protein [Acidobacteriota bacterium]|nr:tetratricopeptide repeat protein [Acidobacteriota bacterium]
MLTALLLWGPAQAVGLAQLPAGTTDTTAAPAQDPLRAQAASALDQHDYATALRLLTTLTTQHPGDAHLLYDLGATQEALDQDAAAAASYRSARDAAPTMMEPQLALGLLLARTGQMQAAHEALAAAVAVPGSDPLLKARAYRGLARLDVRSNPAGASADLLEALKLSPETTDDLLLSAEISEAANDLPAATATYRRLLATDANNADAAAGLAHVLLRQGQVAEAEPLLTKALAAHPGDVAMTAQLAELYTDQDKPELALPLVERLHAANAADAGVTRLLARLYSRNQQYDKAEPLYAALTATSPADPALLDARADALIHLHRSPEAVTLLKQALAHPNSFASPQDLGMAASHLAFAASATNDPVLTLQALKVRDSVLPQSPAAVFLAATATDKLHQIPQAIELYKRFLSVANGKFPDEEWEASHRLITLQKMK